MGSESLWRQTPMMPQEPLSHHPLALARHHLIGRLIAAHEAERSTFADRLHNEVIQELATLTYRLAHLRRAAQVGQLDGEGDESVEQALRACEERVSTAVQMLRGYIGELRPIGLQEFGLAAALHALVSRVRRDGDANGPELCFDSQGGDATLPPEIALTLFRTAQEALHNCVTHARASSVGLHLDCSPGEVALLIEDDGIGFVPPAEASDWVSSGKYGLFTLFERIGSSGGQLSIDSDPSFGTKIRVRFPFELSGEDASHG